MCASHAFSFDIQGPSSGPPISLVTTAADVTGPTVSITSPADGFVVTTPEVVIQGTASDDSGILRVDYGVSYDSVGVGGGFGGHATGKTSWTANITGLFGGTNTVRIIAMDSLSNATTVTIHIFFRQETPLTVLINGSGTVVPNLNGMILQTGTVIQMKEKPNKGYVIAGWSGDIGVKGDTLLCGMQSNLVVQANFVPTPFIPVTGSFEGNINPLTAGPPGGTFRAKITRTGKFSGKIRSENKNYLFSGVFWVDGSYSGLINRKGLPPVFAQLQLDFAARTITGVFTDLAWSSSEPTGGLLATMKGAK